MLPQVLMRVDHFPLTANGKLDKEKLPEPAFTEISTYNAYLAPRNDLETQLARIWQDILNLPQAGVSDDFFRIGGDSLSAIQAVRRMRDVLGKHVKITDLFRFKTIDKLVMN